MNSKFLKSLAKILLSLFIGLLIIWAMYRNTDINELWLIAKSAKFEIIAFSLVFGFVGNIIRGLRWELFVRSLGYYPPRASILYSTLGNFAVNFVLPRAGDFWRCAVVSKYDKIPFSKTLETFLVDKVVDVLSGLLVIFLSVVINIEFFVSFAENNPRIHEGIANFFSSVWLYVILGALVVSVVLLLTVFKHTKFMRKVKKGMLTIKHDMKLISNMDEKRKIFIYTILVWVCFYLYIYICFYAFDFTKDLGPMAGLVVFAMTNIGISVPVQGGIGSWHFFVAASLVIFGVSESNALAFAGAVFAIQSVWQILYGLFGVLAMPYVKREEQ
ncbi:MAG: lysylphosphatidylglycerol synthase transmembrane domain-containing protein [Fermentimonas sp.]|jgi:uncharacterized protein (TIRG00374 family)